MQACSAQPIGARHETTGDVGARRRRRRHARRTGRRANEDRLHLCRTGGRLRLQHVDGCRPAIRGEARIRRDDDRLRRHPGNRRGRPGDGAADQFRPQHHLRDELRLSRRGDQARREISEGRVPPRRRPEDLEERRHLLGGLGRRHVSRRRDGRFGEQDRQARLHRRLPDSGCARSTPSPWGPNRSIPMRPRPWCGPAAGGSPRRRPRR
jgi:hypothetical protein